LNRVILYAIDVFGGKSRGTKLLWEMVFIATTHENETEVDKK